MSRFALRSEVAGARLLALEAAPDWEAFFGQSGPMELEIGCGAGGFALAYCALHPGRRYVAFEWRKKFAREVAHRAEARGLHNLLVVEGDARVLIPRYFRAGTLDAVRVQFPDPWWKRAHQKRAVLQPEFARLLRGLLKPDGIFDLRTDVRDRGERMLAVLEGAGFFNPLGAGSFHPRAEDEVASTRERRYLEANEPVYRARLLAAAPGAPGTSGS